MKASRPTIRITITTTMTGLAGPIATTMITIMISPTS
jgi:hypothetical protein